MKRKKFKKLNNTKKKYLHNYYGQMELISLVCVEDNTLSKGRRDFRKTHKRIVNSNEQMKKKV